jgi:hypothetical protein
MRYWATVSVRSEKVIGARSCRCGGDAGAVRYNYKYPETPSQTRSTKPQETL